MENQLIVFAKNPVLGKVKTRLAATVGNEKALAVYKELLDHTCDISSTANAKKTVFYSGTIEKDDLWSKASYRQAVQNGEDLGARMSNAFKRVFNESNSKVIIIGTDCKELSTEIIDQAFNALDYVDIVL
jgi:uncharacterized protein